MKINYFNGKKTVELELADEQAAVYNESKREEWCSNKRAERHQSKIQLSQIKDNQNRIVKNLKTSDPLQLIVQREETLILRSQLFCILKDLTRQQQNLVQMLLKGMTVTEIALKLNLTKAAVSQMRRRIQEKFKKVLY